LVKYIRTKKGKKWNINMKGESIAFEKEDGPRYGNGQWGHGREWTRWMGEKFGPEKSGTEGHKNALRMSMNGFIILIRNGMLRGNWGN